MFVSLQIAMADNKIITLVGVSYTTQLLIIYSCILPLNNTILVYNLVGLISGFKSLIAPSVSSAKS